MKKVLAALAASGVLVAGGFAAATISPTARAAAQESTTDETTDDSVRPPGSGVLAEVLDQLVADDVISADQADKIKAALEAKREELGDRFDPRDRGRGQHGPGGFGLEGLLDDGVIDADELASLPEEHPFRDPDGPFAQYLDDGELTLEELQELRGQMAPEDGRGFRGHGFHGFGGNGLGDMAPSDEASA